MIYKNLNITIRYNLTQHQEAKTTQLSKKQCFYRENFIIYKVSNREQPKNRMKNLLKLYDIEI